MRGCLSLPFRLLSLAIMVLLAYLAWENRDNIRRWIHRMTAQDAPPADSRLPPDTLRRRSAARLDSLERRQADSVVLSAHELQLLISDGVPTVAHDLVDSIAIKLGRGTISVRARFDGRHLPPGSLGPLTDWIDGQETVEARGPLALRRVGLGAWQLEAVKVRGLPLPRPLWSRLLATVAPVSDGTITFELPAWVTGLRVTPGGAVLYGGRVER